MNLIVYADAASGGGGPEGPSAIAYLILESETKYVLEKDSKYIGYKTNNQAEYEALITALRSAIKFGDSVICYSDSKLMVGQINGTTKIIDSKMRTEWRKVVGLKERFKKISFAHTPRSNRFIYIVDQLAKQTLRKARKELPEVESEDEGKRQPQLTFFLKARARARKLSILSGILDSIPPSVEMSPATPLFCFCHARA